MIRRVFVMATALLLALTAHALAQTSIAGTWSIEPSGRPGELRFDLRTDGNGAAYHDESSHDVDARTLGLSSAQLASGGSHVAFTMTREAGAFACEGWIANAKGGGTFVFTPSPAYLAKMRDRGYGDISPHKQMTAAQLDLTIAYIDSIAAAGYARLPFDQLIAFRALDIDEAFVRSMHASFGGAAIDADQIIALRALGITPAYVSDLRGAGLAVATPRDAVQMRALHVDVAYMHELASVGYAHLDAQQLTQLRALGIDAAYIKRVRAHGFPNPSVEQLVRLKAMNVI